MVHLWNIHMVNIHGKYSYGKYSYGKYSYGTYMEYMLYGKYMKKVYDIWLIKP